MKTEIRRARALAVAALAGVLVVARVDAGDAPDGGPGSFPTIRAGDVHARALLAGAMRYVDPANAIVDPASGYPFEGWNQDPGRGVFLRSFTQLTAIGLYLELLANVVAGHVETPSMTREVAIGQLGRLVATLRRDQADPRLGAQGLLVNFLDLATGKRLGPLASDVDRSAVLAAFGPDKGAAIWDALVARGWIAPRNKGREAEIRRTDGYGYEHFDGALKPFADEPTRQKLMAILDERVVLVVFGDNANLSTSVAKAIGALLAPGASDRPGSAAIRADLESFLDAQAAGYAGLYDPKVGLFDFGRDVARGRLFGWEDANGEWTTGHMDYLVNEFRGPATFVAARFGLPAAAVGNLGFRIKAYRTQDGRMIQALAPWEGSAFQAMGLGLSLDDLDRPSWRGLLRGVVAIEADYSDRAGLPGFLSESYTGEGARYTGAVGIPEITVSPKPRITDAASLYTLGVAYTIAPDRVEPFLAAHWPAIAGLATGHGPWEGYNITRKEPIRFQTTAHTLSLILGLLGTGPANMKRYVDGKGLAPRLDAIFPAGTPGDLLDASVRVFAWSDRDGGVATSRPGGAFRIDGRAVRRVGIAFVPPEDRPLNLSGGRLTLRYRSSVAIDSALIALKPRPGPPADGLIPKEIVARLDASDGAERALEIPLPATVGLASIREVVLTSDRGDAAGPIGLTITGFAFAPVR